jgi:C4-dicarboxylate transporter, DctM subunit
LEHGAWVALGTLIGLLFLLMLSVPIWISMIVAAFAGFWLIGGSTYTLQQFSTAPYYITASFSFAVVPLFILMSILAAECGIAGACYETFSKWVGGIRGGLLVATVMGSALFGACSGMSLASVAVFAKVALPELEKNNYDKSISTAYIAASGVLSSLIPPSVPVVIFCILLNLSIGRTLIAGIVPGIALAVLLSLSVLITGYFKPRAMPKITSRISWKERFWSLRLTGPVIFVILVVIGGIYLGIFAPTVGGAIGSLAILLIAMVRRIKAKTIIHSFYETVLVNAQIYPLVIGGFIYARFVAVSKLPDNLMDIIVSANLSPLLLMFVIVIFYLVIGCLLDFMSMLIITLPLVYPLLTGVGFDPLAIMAVILILMGVAGITPPVGMSVFIVSGVAKVKPETVFKGIIPSFLVYLGLIALIAVFPQIVTWLPNLFYGKLS